MNKEIYNWTKHSTECEQIRPPKLKVEIDNETFRDGMQGTQVSHHPNIEQISSYLKEVSRLKYSDHFDIGFPASGPKHREQIVTLVNFATKEKLDLSFSAAGRGAAIDDVKAVLDVSHKTGVPFEADLFLDASTLRAKVEGWDKDKKLKQLKDNIEFAKKEGLSIMFVPERASVTKPEELLEACKIAVDAGADRIGIADTTGVLTPKGTSNIFRFIFSEIGEKYKDVKFDFHEHEDLQMGIANCVVAANEGVDRLHATSRGIGERAGNVALEQLLVVLNLQGFRNTDTQEMQKFVLMASDILSVPISSHEAIVGPESTATASGVHASTYVKNVKGTSIYLPYPEGAEYVGLKAQVRIGPMSSLSNVYEFCKEMEIEAPTEEKAMEILTQAKENWALLSVEDVKNTLGRNGENH